ncbi:hypothetical protein HMPREF9442_01362 [Paraprevotella xylaniphila YIT 11841]|uniref:Uncharacterized protein n=1 Tax=Paraprevotella xylaniphila YIT 11841 TaxID=762982 RepID=F3QT45_9BACT|nr:hypothetical protein HMPREF9442_01362 [Paraprevotella xylaniphila YIT 11841]
MIFHSQPNDFSFGAQILSILNMLVSSGLERHSFRHSSTVWNRFEF